ncbi:MAG TPA: hypothetical protein PK239_01640 [Chitinophagales bacterium]|nr:hypothetical protein [Chitinophagales bacterium]HRK25968.1 hypothetical protein [Chitinophagales bacterium]
MTYIKLPSPVYKATQHTVALKLALLAVLALVVLGINVYLYTLKQTPQLPFTEQLISGLMQGVKNLLV